MKILSQLVILLWICTSSFAKKSLSSPLKVGVAVATINPPIGSYIAGDKQNRKFTAIHDDLYAKALVISAGQEQVAIVTIDCIGLLYPDVKEIRMQVAKICQFPAERIIVGSTHTHTGPDVVGIWGKDYTECGRNNLYIATLIQTVAQQVKKAFDNQQVATAYTTETTFGESWVKNICNEELDRTVSIIQFRTIHKKPIATLTNFACHPTFMDAVTSEVSADYIHGYYETIRKKQGGEGLFLQGAIGGWVQPEGEPKTFVRAYQRGRELGDTVIKALQKAVKIPSNEIIFKSKAVSFKVENEGWKQLSAIGTIKRSIADSVSTEICWFSIGNAQFITHPGETAPYYSIESKKLMGNGVKFVIGLGNDGLGYILKPAYFENKQLPHAEYLTRMSVGKSIAPALMQAIQSLIPKR